MILKTKQQPVEFDPEWAIAPAVTFVKDKKQCTGLLVGKNTIAYVSYPENRWFEFKTELWSLANGSGPKKEKKHSEPERVPWDDSWNQLPSVELQIEGKHCKGRLIGPNQIAYAGGRTSPVYFTVNSEHWQYVKARLRYSKESQDYHSTFAGFGNIVKKSVWEILQHYPSDAFSRIDTECYVYSNDADRLSGLNTMYETLISSAATKEQWIKNIMNAFVEKIDGGQECDRTLSPAEVLQQYPTFPVPEPLKSRQTGTRAIYRTATYPIVCIHRGTGMHKLMVRQGPEWVKFGHDSEPEQIVGLLKNFLEDELDFKFFLLDCSIPDIPSGWMGIPVTASKNFKGELQCL